MKFIFSLLLCTLLNGHAAVTARETRNGPDNIVCTILYNNTSVADSVIADHGFSCLIESGDRSILFDAGRISNKFIANVNKLAIDCSRISTVFISHIHGDHMGGLFDILAKCNKPALCLPFSYPQMPGETLGDGADADFKALLERFEPLVSEIVRKKEPVKINDGFCTTGMMGDRTYEHALIVSTSNGLVIITGCAHPGIVEIVRRAKELMKEDVYFVMGGFHLVRSDSSQVKNIARELRNLTKYVGPCHCTGANACSALRDVFKDDYIDIQAGLKFTLGSDISE